MRVGSCDILKRNAKDGWEKAWLLLKQQRMSTDGIETKHGRGCMSPRTPWSPARNMHIDADDGSHSSTSKSCKAKIEAR